MATEVFNNIGESEIYSENPFFKRQRKEFDGFESFETSDKIDKIEKVESVSKPITEAKKEFFEHLNDESLTIDACEKLTHDWEKK